MHAAQASHAATVPVDLIAIPGLGAVEAQVNGVPRRAATLNANRIELPSRLAISFLRLDWGLWWARAAARMTRQLVCRDLRRRMKKKRDRSRV